MSTTSKPSVLDVRGAVVTQSTGQPQANALVQAMWLDQGGMCLVGGAPVAALTGSKGNFSLTMQEPGPAALKDGQARLLLTAVAGRSLIGSWDELVSWPGRITGIVIELDDLGQATPTPTPPQGQSDPLLGEIADAIANLGGGPPGSGVSNGDDLDQIFNDAMFRVLGQRVRPDQPRDLQMAFERVFVAKEVDGRSEIEYRGASATATLPIEPGNVTSGLQAVVFRRALAELAPVRQALAELEATDDDDADELAAERDVAERKLNELITALGQEIRPPIKRVDGIFTLLIGDPCVREKSSLARIGNLIGYPDSHVLLSDLLDETCTSYPAKPAANDDVTKDDDLTATRFIEVVSFVTGLHFSWEQVKKPLGQVNGTVPLGTRLALLSRLLDWVAEGTDDLETALLIAGLDAAQWEFIEIAVDPKNPSAPTSLAELIRWLREFSVDGKSYDSGRGITVVQTTAESIQPLIVDVLEQIDDFPELDKRAIVQALSQLSRALMQIQAA